MKINGMIQALLILAIALVFTQVAVAFYLIVWPANPITIMDLKVDGHFDAGEPVRYTIEYCKPSTYGDAYADVHYNFLGERGYLLPGTGLSDLEVGCHIANEAIPAPMLPPGYYRMEMLRVYHVNALRDVTVRAVSQPFQVH